MSSLEIKESLRRVFNVWNICSVNITVHPAVTGFIFTIMMMIVREGQGELLNVYL